MSRERKLLRVYMDMGYKILEYSNGERYVQKSRNCNGVMSTWLERIK